MGSEKVGRQMSLSIDKTIRIVATELLNQAIVNLQKCDVSVTCRRTNHYNVISLLVTNGQYHVEHWLTYREVLEAENYHELIECVVQACDAKMKDMIGGC
jgi:hypothetical protein